MDHLTFILSLFSRKRYSAWAQRRGPTFMKFQAIVCAIFAIATLGIVAYSSFQARELRNFTAESRLTKGRVVSFDRNDLASKLRSTEHKMLLTFEVEDSSGHMQTKSEELSFKTLPEMRPGSEIGVYLSSDKNVPPLSELSVKDREYKNGWHLLDC